MDSWNLKPVLVVASLGMMAVVGDAAAQAPISWSKSAVPPNAVVGGGPAGTPMHVCRMPMANKEVHPGKEWKGNCYVSFGGKELKAPVKNAEILATAAPTAWVAVQGGKFPPGIVKAGESRGKPIGVCRAKAQDGQMHPGKLQNGTCYHGYGGKEIKAKEFEVLTLAPVAAKPATPAAAKTAAPAPAAAPAAPAKPTAPAAAAPAKPAAAGQTAASDPLTWSKGVIPPNAVVAGGSKEKPMHICRMPMADKALHPGKAENGNCYVGFGGKEIKAPLKDAEVLATSAPVGWATVKGGKLPSDALKADVVNGVPMHFCRAKHQAGAIHAGKEYKGSCYYGYGGKEIKAAEFQIMGVQKLAAKPAAPSKK